MRSQDAEYFRVLDELMTGDEILFRVGIGHLLSVGYENLTEEAVLRARGALATQAGSTAQRDVRRTIEVIEKEASEMEEEAIPVITPEYQIAILRMASRIREVPLWTLLKYISRKVKIS